MIIEAMFDGSKWTKPPWIIEYISKNNADVSETILMLMVTKRIGDIAKPNSSTERLKQ